MAVDVANRKSRGAGSSTAAIDQPVALYTAINNTNPPKERGVAIKREPVVIDYATPQHHHQQLREHESDFTEFAMELGLSGADKAEHPLLEPKRRRGRPPNSSRMNCCKMGGPKAETDPDYKVGPSHYPRNSKLVANPACTDCGKVLIKRHLNSIYAHVNLT